MSLKKGCLFTVILGVLALVGAYFVATNSSVQTKFANSFLEKNFAGSSIQKVAITPFSIEIDGINLKLSEDKIFTAEKLSAKYFLPDLMFKSLEISELNLQNALFEIKEIQGTEQPAGTAQIASKAQNAAQNSENSTLAKNLNSANSKSSQTQKSDSTFPELDIKIINANADFSLILADSSKISNKLSLKNFRAKNTVFAESFELDLQSLVALKQTDFKETHVDVKASFDSSNAKLLVLLKNKKIVQLIAKVDSEFKNFETQTQLILSDEDLSDFIKDTPKFSVNLISKLNFDSSLQNALLNISGAVKASQLESVSEKINSIKSVNATCEISAEKRANKISLANAEAILSANGSQLLRLKNSRSFEFNANEISKLPNGNLISLELASISPDFVNAFLKNMAVNFHNNPAKFTLAKQDEHFEISTDAKLELIDFSFSKDGNTIVKNISPALAINAISDLKNHAIKLALNSDIAKDDSLKADIAARINADKSTNADISLNGSLAQVASEFAPKDIALPRIDSSFSINFADGILTAEKMRLDLLQDSVKITSLEMPNKLVFNTKTSSVESFPIKAKILMEKTPFAIFAPFTKGANADYISLNMSIELASKDSGNLNASAQLKNFSFVKDGVYQVRDIDASTDISVALKNGEFSTDIKSFKLAQNSGEILSANSKANAKVDLQNKTYSLVGAELSAQANLPQILKQPALQKFDNAHYANAKLTASLNDKNELDAELKIENLKPRTSHESVAALTAQIKSALQNFVPQTAQIKVQMQSERSNSEIFADVDMKDEIACKISANTINIDDLLLIKDAFKNPNADGLSQEKVGENQDAKKKIARPKEAVEIAKSLENSKIKEPIEPAQNPQKALWDFGKSLKLNASVKEIIFKNEPTLTNLTGILNLNQTQLNLESLQANLYGTPANAELMLFYTKANSYDLQKAKFSVEKFPIQKFLKPNGAGEYFLEGDFSFAGDLTSAGTDTSGLLKNMQGNVSMNAQNGVLRLIDKSTTAGQITSVGTSLLKISAAFLGDKVKELDAISQITERIQELNISTLNISAQKKNSSLKITKAKIEADPLLLILGGQFENFDFENIGETSLSLPVRIFSKKGDIGNLFESIGFEKQENSDYLKGPQFEIYGNITKPENNLLETLTNMYKNIGIKKLLN